MFPKNNFLIDENDDNDFSSRNYNQSSRPINQPTNNNPMISRNLIGSEAKRTSIPSFMKSGNNYDQMSSSPEQDRNTNYLDKIKTLNSQKQTPSTLFRPATSVYQKKEEPIQQNEDFNRTGFENQGNYDNPGLSKANSVQVGMRPQSSQSQNNLYMTLMFSIDHKFFIF